MMRIILTALITASFTFSANSQNPKITPMTKSHRLAFQQVATITALERFCPTMQANNFILGAMLIGSGVKEKHIGKNGEYFHEIVAMNNEALISFSQETKAQVCWTANYLYGTNGTLIPNLMIPR